MKIPKRTLRSGGIQGSRATRWIFVGPAMLVVICLLIYPLLSTLIYSFTNKTMIRNEFDVVGLKNYLDILTDKDFYSAFGHTLLWTLFSVLGQLIVGFIGALAVIVLFVLFLVQGLFPLPPALPGRTSGGPSRARHTCIILPSKARRKTPG